MLPPLNAAPFVLISVLASLAYGLVLQFRPISLFRTLTKSLAIGAVAVWAFMAGAPALLTTALAFSCLGDAILTRDGDLSLPLGLASFLVAQLVYCVFFLEIGGMESFAAEPVRLIPGALALAGGGLLTLYLWRDLGQLKAPVGVYVIALSAMVGASFSLHAAHAMASLGSVLFSASDAVLAIRLFKLTHRPSPLADHAVWWLYVAAQGLIATAFLV